MSGNLGFARHKHGVTSASERVGARRLHRRRAWTAAGLLLALSAAGNVGSAHAEIIPALAAPLRTTATDSVIYDRNNTR